MSLPLTKKLNDDSLFSQLNLSLSSKWPNIKKSYDIHVKELKSDLINAKDADQKAKIELDLNRLDASFKAGSKRLSEQNASMYETKNALKSIGLPVSSDWDNVTKRFEEILQVQPDKANEYQSHLSVLEKNKNLLIPKVKLGQRTLLTSALVLGGAGVSLAAFHYLSQEEKEEVLAVVDQETIQDPDSMSLVSDGTVLTGVDQNALDEYVYDNTSFEDEIFSLIGMLPPPTLSLTIQ